MIFIECFFAIFYGAIVGNFATTMYYRIPNNIPINGLGIKNGPRPHCSKCGHQLRFYEYLPILSWISSPLRCNYCHEKKDISYTVIEIFGITAALVLALSWHLYPSFVFDVFLATNSLLTIMFLSTYNRVYVKNVSILLATFAMRLAMH